MSISQTPTAATTYDGTHRLRRLHLARSGFAVGWAVLLVVSGPSITALSATLLVLYPLVDAAAALVDLRSSRSARARRTLAVNAGLSLVAAAGLAAAAASGRPDVLRAWGAWAIAAGVLQLAVAVQRRSLDGQWPLVLSGAISTLAGAGFVAAAAGDDPSLGGLAGYAVLGGVFFLVSALRSRRGTADA